MNKNHIRVIANSHIDPVWLWDKYEGIDEVINTFSSACDRLDEYPDVRFSASTVCFYEWVEEHASDLFERIKAHVISGRWEIVGGWWVEADCNLPAAESFHKSAKISKRYIREKFGVDVPVAYCPDAFGHPASLPEILADDGFKYYVFCRPGPTEFELPSNLFYWEHNGKRVLCYRLKYHYTQQFNFSREKVEESIATEDFFTNGLACYFFGMGDHGGGPTKAEIEAIREIRENRKDLNIEFSTSLEFFREAEKLPDIPVFTGDLQPHAVGCYSVNRNIKQAVRSAERALCHTQRVLDSLDDGNVDLDPLWKKVIFNQFHDILPGSCSPDAARQAIEELGGVQEACASISHKALRKAASTIPVKCPQGEFRMYNSLPGPVTGPFEIESFMYFRPGAPFKDATGTEIPVQEITPSCSIRRWVFVDTIPAESFKSYYFDSKDGPSVVQEKKCFYTPGEEVSLGGLKIEAPGQITDTRSGKKFFKSPLALSAIRDGSDTWGHDVDGYGEPEGYFEEISSSINERSIAAYLISRQKYGQSSAELWYAVYKDLPYVDLTLRIRWLEENSVLKLDIQPNSDFTSLLVQGPGAYLEKKTQGIEEPLHGWMQAGNVGILQDGAFAFDRVGDKIRITLIRSNLYGYDQGTKLLDPNGPMWHTDIGEHMFKFRFIRRQSLTGRDMDDLLAAFLEPFRVIRNSR